MTQDINVMTASRTWKYEKSTQNNMKTSNFVYIITLYIVCFILYQFSAKAASKAAGSPSLARLVLNNYLWEWNRILVLKILHFVLVIFNQVYDWRYENYKVFFSNFYNSFTVFFLIKRKTDKELIQNNRRETMKVNMNYQSD